MLAILSTSTYDFSGYVEIDLMPEYTDGQVQRRVNRVSTLDGGAVINDGGFSDSDRTFELRWAPTAADTEANIERLVRDYSTIDVSVRSGVFRAAPEVYTPRANESTLRLLVIEKLSS